MQSLNSARSWQESIDHLEADQRKPEDQRKENERTMRQRRAAPILDRLQYGIGNEVQSRGNDGEQYDFHEVFPLNVADRHSISAGVRA